MGRGMGMGIELGLALDRVAFARYLGIEPDEWQKRILLSPSPKIIVCGGRQIGKSLITAILALHRAIFYPGSLILVVAPSLRQSSELFRKIVDAYIRLGSDGPDPLSWTKLSLEFKTRSRIQCLPSSEETVRGFSSVALAIFDEAARIEDQVFAAILPSLAVSRGKIMMISTPLTRTGFFAKVWFDGGPEWERYHVPSTLCARISAEFLESERRTLGEWMFRREYLAEFAEDGATFISFDSLSQVISSEVRSWNLGFLGS